MLSLNKTIGAFILAAVLCCPARGAILEDVVAKVNGRPLMLSEYKKNLRSVLDNYRQGAPRLLRDEAAVKEIRTKVLDQMIDDEILALRAEEMHVKVHSREVDKGVEEIKERSFRVDPKTRRRRTDKEIEETMREELRKEGLTQAKFRKRIEKQLKIRKVVEGEVRAKLKEPDEKRTRKAFELIKKITLTKSTAAIRALVKDKPAQIGQGYIAFALRVRDVHSERVRVSHILVNASKNASMKAKSEALAKINGIRKRIVGGEDFFEVARKESEDLESAPRGGDLGFMLHDWMQKPFTDAAFSLPVGEISEPVLTDFGYHLIRVQEKKAREPIYFEKLRVDIKQFLMNMDFQAHLLKLVKKLRKKATIEVKLPVQ